ncbi:Mitochondrial transcription factor 1 [Serendipita sp. 407]|nr:Mitochondrial transcription factor 1 [Serendipita sp. 407]
MLRLSRQYICPRCQTGSNLGRRTVATQHARGYRQPKLSNEIPIPEASADGQLPPWDQWKEKFGLVARPKPTLHNMATARKIVKGFGIAEASSPKVVLEVFAGPGAISRALTRGKGPENMVAVNFKPLGYQMMRVAGVPEWDFVLRALWIHKKTPVGSSLKFMAPGAQNMVKYMDQSKLGLLEKSPRDLSMDEWSILMDAFDKWPFHPRDNALSDSVLTTDKRIR